MKTNVKLISGRSTSGESIYSGDLKFAWNHGKNARISSSGITACRPNALGEFNAAIVVSSRALKDNELFEVIIERMVDRWSGNIEVKSGTSRTMHVKAILIIIILGRSYHN
jgi:hypothetical protein